MIAHVFRPVRRLSLAFLLLLAGVPAAHADNPFGITLWPGPGQDLSLLAARASGLGVSWVRPPAVFVDHWQPGQPCRPCEALARTGLHVALTVRHGGEDFALRRPSSPPSDLTAYANALATILDAWKPAVLVVENEENDPSFYTAGGSGGETAAAYGRELAAACAMAHQRGIACANGGLSGASAAALTWLDLLDRGRPDMACSFARRAFYGDGAHPQAARLCTYHTPEEVPQALKADLLRGADLFLAVYRSAPIDAVNLHWYGRDAGALALVADTLARLAGKPVMSNELGLARADANPANVRPLLRAAFAAGIRPAIWFSVDTPYTASLFNPDGTLRPTGSEFARQMSGRK